jgi:hypothetical protein
MPRKIQLGITPNQLRPSTDNHGEWTEFAFEKYH